MTRSSRSRSGSRPTSLPPTKAELDAREKGRQVKEAAENISPELRSVQNRQVRQFADLATRGASKKEIEAAGKRFAEERALLEDD